MPPSGGAQPLDPALVGRARSGDRDALGTLVTRAYPLVRRWARGWTRDPDDADDLTQDVMVRMIRTLESYRGDSRFSSWLYAMTRNRALDRGRARRREEGRRTRDTARSALGATGSDDPGDALDARRAGDALEAHYRGLPERQREVFDLVELQGLTSTEAAGLMGIEPVSVRAHLHKARRALRSAILREHPYLVPNER